MIEGCHKYNSGNHNNDATYEIGGIHAEKNFFTEPILKRKSQTEQYTEEKYFGCPSFTSHLFNRAIYKQP